MTIIEDFYNNISNYNNGLNGYDDLKSIINICLGDMFPKLDIDSFDYSYLYHMVYNLILTIKKKFNIPKRDLIEQFKQNNYRDTRSCILLLIPFIDDKNDNKLFKKIYDLNQILYFDPLKTEIDKNLFNYEMTEARKLYFPICNFSLGLINENNELKLVNENGEKLIYEIMYNNYISLIETLTRINGKLYVNWINIRPINFSMFKQYKKILNDNTNGIIINNTNYYNLFNTTIKNEIRDNRLNRLNIFNETYFQYYYIKHNLSNQNLFFDVTKNNKGLWIGDFYNVFRNGYYESIRKIKWLIFNINEEYFIQKLNNIYKLKNVIKYESYDNLSIKQKEYFIRRIKDSSRLLNNNYNKQLYQTFFTFMITNFSYKEQLYDDIINKINDNKELELKKLEKLKNKINKIKGNTEEIDYDDKDNNQNNIIEEFKNFDIKFLLNNIEPKYIWNYIKECLELFKHTPYYYKIIKNDKVRDNDDFFYIKDNVNLKNIYNIAKWLSHTNLITYNDEETNDNDDGNLYYDINNNTYYLLPKNYSELSIIEQKIFWCKFCDYDRNHFNNIFNGYIFLDEDENDKEINNKNNNINKLIQEFNINSNLKREYPDRSDNNLEDTIFRNNIRNKIKNYFFDYKIDLIFNYLIENGLLSYFIVNTELTDKSNYSIIEKKRNKQYKEKLKKQIKTIKNDINSSYYYLNNKQYHQMDKMRVKDKKEQYDFKEKDYLETVLEDQFWYKFYAMDWITQISFFHKYIYNQIMYVTGSTGQGKSTQVPKLLLYALKMIDYKSNGKIICTQPRIPPTVGNATRISDELGVPIEEKSKLSNDKIKSIKNFNLQYKHQKDNHTSNTQNLKLKLVTDGTLMEEMIQNKIMLKPFKNNGKIKELTDDNLYDIIIVDEAHEHNKNMDIILSMARHTCYFNQTVRLIIISATMDDDEPIYRSYYKCINDNLISSTMNNKYTYPKQRIPNPFINDNYIIPNSLYIDRRFHISPPGESTQYTIDEHYINYPEVDEPKINSQNYQNKAYDIIKDIISSTQSGELLFFCNGKKEINNAVERLNRITPPNVIALPYHSELHKNYKDIIEDIGEKKYKIKTKKENVHIQWSDEWIEDNNIQDNIYNRVIIIATNVAEASITIDTLKYVIDNGYAKESIYDIKFGTTKMIIDKISEASRIQRKGRVGRTDDGTVYYLYKKGGREMIKTKYNITKEDFTDLFMKLLYGENISPLDPRYIIKYYNYYENQLSDYFNNFPYNKKLDIIKYEKNKLKEYITGYDSDLLFDKFGKFYIIHPFETDIKRNVCLDIIQYDNKNYNKIPDYAYFNFIENMKLTGFVGYHNNDLIKNELIGKISKLTSLADENNNKLLYTILIAECLDIQEEILLIISLLSASSFSPSKVCNKPQNLNNISAIFGFYNSDITMYYKISNLIKSRLSHLYPFKINKSEIKKLKNVYDELINYYIDNIDEINKNPFEPPKKLFNDINLFNTIRNEGYLNQTEKEKDKILNRGFSLWLKKSSYVNNKLKENLNEYKMDIKKICDDYYLNENTINSFLQNYFWKQFDILTAISNLEEDEKTEDPFEFVKNNFSSNFQREFSQYDLHTKINLCFAYPYSSNIIFRPDINKPDEFINYKGKSKTFIKKIFDKYPDTFVNNINNINIYIQFDIENGVSCLISDSITKIIKSNPLVFNPINFKNIYYHNNKITELNNFVWNEFLMDIHNNFNLNNNPLQSSNKKDDGTYILQKMNYILKNIKKEIINNS